MLVRMVLLKVYRLKVCLEIVGALIKARRGRLQAGLMW
jgi:hypothetical protein